MTNPSDEPEVHEAVELPPSAETPLGVTPAVGAALEPTAIQPQNVSSDPLSVPPSDSSLELVGGHRHKLPGYEILGVLERGGMGVIYKARQVGIDRLVALKMVRSGECAEASELARFQAEARAVAQLEHPHIVRIYDFGEWRASDTFPALPYFSMEFVDGGSLDKQLAAGPLPLRRAAELAEVLARAVHFVHQRGVVHRDLKPANVLLTATGVPKIADFGLAKRLDGDSGLTLTKTVMGTASYMAPEQAAGKTRDVGAAADVHALGAILYEMMSGRPPFKADTREMTILQVMTEEPAPPTRLRPEIPRELEAICLKCLEKEPGLRYADAEVLAEDLRRWLCGEPISITMTSEEDRHIRWARRAGYEIQELLGCGRTGFVYKARQLSLGRIVTLKLLHVGTQPNPAEMGRFRAEAEAVARMHHSNIAQIYDLGEQQGQPYLVLEYVEGTSLAEKIAHGPLPAREAAEIVESLARTLQYAHQRGIVHCGLTPRCVLLSQDGMPKITRFGLARMLGQLSEPNDEQSPALPLPTYAAPEQLDGHSQTTTPMVDIYGLGGILYALLVGQPPFRAETLRETRELVLSRDPTRPTELRPDAPQELEAICLKCLRKTPDDRYPNMEALAKDLQRFLAAESARGDPPALARLVRTAIPGYAISGELGRSARSTAYKALQTSRQRIVALKVVVAETADSERMRQAIERISKIPHPYVVPVYDVGTHSGLLYVASELMSGGNLASKCDGSMPYRKTAELIEQVAAGLHQGHQIGLVHGGLKPANVLFSQQGTAKVADFGTALPEPGYTSPEQARGEKEIGPASDIFAIGTLLYQLLTGLLPFRGEMSADVMKQILSVDPVVPSRLQPNIPPKLEAICLRCLRKSPGERYPTTLALSEDLRRCREGSGWSGIITRLAGWINSRKPKS